MSVADVCLLLEGTYPYVAGGVSTWTHELIQKQSHLTFHVVSIVPRDAEVTMRFEMPKNVIGHTTIRLQRLPDGEARSRIYRDDICPNLQEPLTRLMSGKAELADFQTLITLLGEAKGKLGSKVLLDSEESWNLLLAMYEKQFGESSFLDYFWSWRALIGGLYSLLLEPLPKARCYHAMSTGYAGLLAARAKIETSAPVMVTEHGIYTNERRVEIASASWLDETSTRVLSIDPLRRDLRDLWMDSFGSYSRICYQAVDKIVTLYAGNQSAQLADGAELSKMQVISNGVDIERFARLPRKTNGSPTVALIGRVVPIKDIKNFIRAVYILHKNLNDVKAIIIGPLDEDAEYVDECINMIEHLGLRQIINLTGKVNVDEYYPQIDVLALTSISEAQPLVILEAGACGIPTVSTDVGACSELILGKADERPHAGAGGIITPLANPTALAEAMFTLLTQPERYAAQSTAIAERVRKYYNKNDQHAAYKALYAEFLEGRVTSRALQAA
jgi:glycosyltransferase involved in cell wall biosynthesis